MVSIVVSFAVMVVSIAISAGFKSEIRAGLADICGDLRVVPANASITGYTEAVNLTESMPERLRAIPGVAVIRPVIYRAGVVSAGEDICGALFRGVDMADADSAYYDSGLGAFTAVDVPRTLADKLCLCAGDAVRVYYIGESLTIRKLTVRSIYENIVTGDDRLVVNCDIDMLRRINQWEAGQCSAVEIVLQPSSMLQPVPVDEVKSAVQDVISASCDDDSDFLLCESLSDTFPQLFDWLLLIDSNVSLILMLLVVAAGFNMIIALLILLFEHIHNIGVLKALGMRSGTIVAVYLRSCLRQVTVGLVCGNALALSFCAVQSHFHLVKLNPVNYFLSYVPVSVDYPAMLLFNLAALAVIALMLLIPCRFITSVDPSRTLSFC